MTQNEDIFPFPVRFLPDGRFLYTADGKMRTRAADGANPADIAFSARLTLRRPVFKDPKDRGFDRRGPRLVRGISAPVLPRMGAASPSGRSMALPKLSPDGARVAYTTLSGQLEIRTRATGAFDVVLPSISTQVSTPK